MFEKEIVQDRLEGHLAVAVLAEDFSEILFLSDHISSFLGDPLR